MTKKEIQEKYAAENAMFEIAEPEPDMRPSDLLAVFKACMIVWIVVMVYIAQQTLM